eukprot:scaffold6860_cov66-Skeletonema_marinoi.AAC.3
MSDGDGAARLLVLSSFESPYCSFLLMLSSGALVRPRFHHLASTSLAHFGGRLLVTPPQPEVLPHSALPGA